MIFVLSSFRILIENIGCIQLQVAAQTELCIKVAFCFHFFFILIAFKLNTYRLATLSSIQLKIHLHDDIIVY